MRTVLIKMDNCVIFLIENGDYIIFTETNHGLTSYILYSPVFKYTHHSHKRTHNQQSFKLLT